MPIGAEAVGLPIGDEEVHVLPEELPVEVEIREEPPVEFQNHWEPPVEFQNHGEIPVDLVIREEEIEGAEPLYFNPPHPPIL